jgi:hypothetical protein
MLRVIDQLRQLKRIDVTRPLFELEERVDIQHGLASKTSTGKHRNNGSCRTSADGQIPSFDAVVVGNGHVHQQRQEKKTLLFGQMFVALEWRCRSHELYVNRTNDGQSDGKRSTSSH